MKLCRTFAKVFLICLPAALVSGGFNVSRAQDKKQAEGLGHLFDLKPKVLFCKG